MKAKLFIIIFTAYLTEHSSGSDGNVWKGFRVSGLHANCEVSFPIETSLTCGCEMQWHHVCDCVRRSGSWFKACAPIWAATQQQRSQRLPRRTWSTLIKSWQPQVTACWMTRRCASWRTTWQLSTTSWAPRWGNSFWISHEQLEELSFCLPSMKLV